MTFIQFLGTQSSFPSWAASPVTEPSKITGAGKMSNLSSNQRCQNIEGNSKYWWPLHKITHWCQLFFICQL